MTASNQLTTLANVKAWAGVTTSNDDALLTRLIASASRFILSYLQRPTLFQNIFSDVYDGVGGEVQILRNWPVLSVTSITVGMQAIPPAPLPATGYGAGFVIDPWDGFPPGKPQALTLRGYRFFPGWSNVNIVYTAGFVVQNEAHAIPASGPYEVTVNAPNGNWAVDQGVTLNGLAMTPVPGTPAAGQYSVANGVYTFASANAGAAVLVSYSYVPADIEQACIEMVGERYSYKNRVGYVSKSLAGQETVTFSQKDMTDFVSQLLVPFKRVVLV